MLSIVTSKIASFLTSFLFPQTCLFCKFGNKICCDQCFQEISQNLRFYKNNLSLYYYSNHKINQLIWQMKYHHSGEIARLFGGVMAEKLEKEFFPIFPPTTQNIFLIPIPLNQNDKRLHNHAELLANEIKNYLHFSPPYWGGVGGGAVFILNNLLIKNSKQKQSHTKSRQKRIENIKKAFSVNSDFKLPSPLSKMGEENKFIIVDDVTTSGATIAQAKKTIANFLKISEQDIFAVTLAH